MAINVHTVQEIRQRVTELAAKLSLPRRRFCDAWLSNGQNGTQAYLAIFSTNKPTAAAAGASRLMSRSDVRAYLDIMKEYSAEETLNHMSVTKERILNEEAQLAFIDIRQMFDTEGEFKPPHLWPESIARSVSGIDVKQKWDVENDKWKYTYKIKLNDKGRALGRLETVMGMNKADGLQDDDKNLFKSFLEAVDGDSRGRLPSEFEGDKE
jgi:phage terminase small subunit